MCVSPSCNPQRDIVEIAIVDFGKYQSRDESVYVAVVVVMAGRGKDALRVDYIFGNCDRGTVLGNRHCFWKSTPFWEIDTVLGNRYRFGKSTLF